MKKKLLFFVNPNAGHNTVNTHLLEILKLFSASYEVCVYVTEAPREITKMIAEEGRAYDMIVVSGGDGTLNESTAGLLQLPKEQRPVLGYIPAGTVNDVAATLGLSLNVAKAAETVISGDIFELDAGTMNGRGFDYVAAFGAFTSVSYATPSESKHILGSLAYVLEGIKSIGDIRPIHARIRGEGIDEEGDFIAGLFCNTTSVGGFHGSKELVEKNGVELNDGLHELVFVRNFENAGDLTGAIADLAANNFRNSTHFFTAKAKKITVSFDEDITWSLDGEDGGSCREAVLCNVPRAIRIMVPKQEK